VLFTIAAGPRHHILGSECRGSHDRILQSQIQDSLNLEGPVPVFISPKNRVVQLYPQALSSVFVASYDSQSYSGGIQTRLHSSSLTKAGPCFTASSGATYKTPFPTVPFNADDLASRRLATAQLFIELFPRNAQ
jgi:hypothetical protein